MLAAFMFDEVMAVSGVGMLAVTFLPSIALTASMNEVAWVGVASTSFCSASSSAHFLAQPDACAENFFRGNF